ncbi:MAG: hypothetical protein ACXWTR_00630 [Methylotenera sp.]
MILFDWYWAAAVVRCSEVTMTAMFLFIIMEATDKRAPLAQHRWRLA